MFQIENLVVADVIEINELQLSEQVISIEGQSGSGKSTLLRLLNNLDDPTSGDIYFRNQHLTDIEPIALRRKVVMVPQNPVVFDGTIRDNLLIGLKLSGEAAISDKQLEIMLERLWLDKGLDTNASDLSGGEKQRIALGRVLFMEKAEVFLLDEPSSDLDHDTTDHVTNEFIKQASNKQVIIITHNREVSKKFANKIINMDNYSLQVRKEAGHHG